MSQNQSGDEGTKPGLTQSPVEEAVREVSIRCTDPTHCNSTRAKVIMDSEGSHVRTYQCVKCGLTWSVSVGGGVNF